MVQSNFFVFFPHIVWTAAALLRQQKSSQIFYFGGFCQLAYAWWKTTPVTVLHNVLRLRRLRLEPSRRSAPGMVIKEAKCQPENTLQQSAARLSVLSFHLCFSLISRKVKETVTCNVLRILPEWTPSLRPKRVHVRLWVILDYISDNLRQCG